MEPAASSFHYGIVRERPLVAIGDDPERVADARAASDAAERPVARALAFADVEASLSQQISLGGVLVEAAGVAPALLDTALIRVDAIARDRDIGVIVALTPDQIDAACAHVTSPHAQLLVNPSVAERAAAIAQLPSAAARLHDAGRDEAERLRALNTEVARIAATLARLTRDAAAASSPAEGAPPVEVIDEAPPVEARDVRALIRARRLREQFFAAELFADPAWDMLLDLYAAELEYGRVSVSSLCIAAAVPGTTALRWIGTMIDAGLFERQADQFDRRRAFVGLTPKARNGLHRYFAALAKSGLAGG
jgi:DNA-binding MarR family transcriptional regulator